MKRIEDFPRIRLGVLPTPIQKWGSLVGCCLWGRIESDTTEAIQQQQLSTLCVWLSVHHLCDMLYAVIIMKGYLIFHAINLLVYFKCQLLSVTEIRAHKYSWMFLCGKNEVNVIYRKRKVKRECHTKPSAQTSFVVQWLGICLVMQGIWIQSLIQEDSTCHTTTKACTLEPTLLGPNATCTKAAVHKACALQKEKPRQ